MKILTLAFTATLVVLWAAAATVGASDGKDSISPSPSDTTTTATPGVELPELKFEFDPVVDGTQVTHDFAIKNTGDGPLAITQVKTG
jgi:hypothetical protein